MPTDRFRAARPTVLNRGHELVVALEGELDLATAPELESELRTLVELGASRIVVDLTPATFIDASTLGVLVGVLERLQAAGGELVLVCRNRTFLKLLGLTCLDRVFTVYETRAQALAARPIPALAAIA
jgi:anti-sigma B factor antagonist